MLRLENIVKIYPTADSEVVALKGIDLSFRQSEFVSILGPSGCGKTTLLNIIGGLDHYTSGDLIIEGVSTKEYKSHDWDIYRNHRIGFVFQSYNLIPHQNILSNVELSLTIGGLKKKERIAKAKQALDRVGLEGLYNKKPNQLSGGQCQRVAIARALVNEPDILLADEPTGALDTETSDQIMTLIKEVFADKSVIMVTHNETIAKKYSTRIINLVDGTVIGDSNPYSALEEIKEHQVRDAQQEEAIEKAKMSWWTAFKLSGRNLLSKSKRTALISIASCIGILGVSSVLSISYGVRGYITSMQDDMLSGNPISVSARALDLSSLTDSMNSMQQGSAIINSTKDGYINIDFLVEQLVQTSSFADNLFTTNHITDEYAAFVKGMDSSLYADTMFNYGLDVTNNIYTSADINKSSEDPDPDNDVYSLSALTQIATSIVGQTDYSGYASLAASYVDTMLQCLDNEEYVLSQYDVVAGKYATEEDELMIVLNSHDSLTEFFLTLTGYYSQDQFLAVVDKYGDTDPPYTDESNFTDQISIEELMGKQFTYYPNNTIISVNWKSGSTPSLTDLADDSNLLDYIDATRPLLYNSKQDSSWSAGMEMKVVGILTPKDSISYGCMDTGMYYTPKFAQRCIEDGLDSYVAYLCKAYQEAGYDGIISGSYIAKDTDTGDTYTAYTGLYYDIYYSFSGKNIHDYGLVGATNTTSSYMSAIMAVFGQSSDSRSATLTLNNVGGSLTPTSIKIYPNSFNEKYEVTDYLDKWNSNETLTITMDDGSTVTLTADERENITYTDNLQIVISLVNSLIDIVTTALVCFSALALVVSTVMIGVITYVSVMERVKEIGVIRAMGGRKKDVSHLFNAETFIIGFLSGALGVVLAYILEAIINVIVSSLTGGVTIAALPFYIALLMIGLAVGLTMIAGIFPSRSAAHKDPVEALRSE